ncbi:2'-5' RNA ligase superfamily-domain-containing protein [Cladorrhinum samala]|uniref:polynucleotide adenylyltransferase n=1 Tax=Cladorrhinum samala TaxID=585594 RepID=A0AAV9HZZ9_9PEZI|nr:2'-5' RNA ligase superfamily-domain-containing protein [Cladorrhinum samala]
MASADTQFSLTSHDTALALIPPPHLWPRIDRLRSLYDKAYLKWPPHINLLYPFVSPSSLLSLPSVSPSAAFSLSLDSTGVFEHKHSNTLYLTTASSRDQLRELRRSILNALKSQAGGQQFVPHMTVAQTEETSSSAHKFLLEKMSNIPSISWEVSELSILIRERDPHSNDFAMKLWGTINISTGEITQKANAAAFYTPSEEDQESQPQRSYYFDEETHLWVSYKSSDLDSDSSQQTESLKISSWNVLAEFLYPPSEIRYPHLIKNILSQEAEADVLVLQEVTDSFLSFLLSHEEIRETYPFSTHGPPDQEDVDPLPSFLGVVVLSKRKFDWEYVSFARKHKGAVVVRFDDLKAVLAAVHLSHGLTDGAVASKKGDIKRLVGYLDKDCFKGWACVVAGDFNITTSREGIKSAVERGTVSENAVVHLKSLDGIFEDAGFEDAWKATEHGKAVDGGEMGTTWNPVVNGIAKAMAGSGGNVWPQRYDRVLVRGEGRLKIRGFNQFGFLKGPTGEQGSEETFPSDHWGVRCVLEMGDFVEEEAPPVAIVQELSEEVMKLVVPVALQEVEGRLAENGSVGKCLADLGVIPDEEEKATRKEAFDLLKTVILATSATGGANPKSIPAVVVVPVGSYALGIWTSSSDIDVLVIGPFTAHTFFSLASKRLRKAANQGVRILRRVRANTGTMLEIDVSGIRMDLQYCPATSVAERWPQVLQSPASDPVWSLPSQTLNKLKAIRDINIIRRTIPCLDSFGLAHRLIKTWAKSRGIYSARFGYLSGIQISILLTRVYKLLPGSPNSTSVETLLATFFAHYAAFPFSTHLVFDPTFHTSRIPYTRVPSREPLAILGYFPPMLNTATSASLPSVRTLTHEFQLAHELLSSPSTTWDTFLSSPQTPFLTQFKSYIHLSLSYWSLSPSKGLSYLGWFESRCVALLVDLSRRCPQLQARIWPARFIESSELSNPDEDTVQGRAYRGCYLIGLDKLDPDLPKDQLRTALSALRNVLPRFEESIKGDTKYFDPSTKWFAASLVSQSDISKMDLVLDRSEWAEQNAGEEEEEEEEEDSDDEDGRVGGEDEDGGEEGESYDDEERDGDDRLEGESWEAAKRRRRSRKREEKLAAGKKGVVALADLRTDKTKKFRTAQDVINRVRWDASMDSGDYLVGYEDRFLGAQEKELDEWKGEQTDEEFIPQHRILYFKRKSDGRIVWDRRTRWDEVFDHHQGQS